MRLHSGPHAICPGVSYSITPAGGLSMNIQLKMKWYGLLFLAWKNRKQLDLKRYQYPKAAGLLVLHSIKQLLKK